MNICIIIPVYNESQEIGSVVKGVVDKKLDVVLIDDGSTDGSGKIAEENGAIVLRNEAKSGKGASLQRGFAYAIEKGYDGIITMDGDGQHAVSDLDSFLQEIALHPNSIVTGSRMSHTKEMPFVRYLTNKLMSWFISGICKQKVPDTQCGYRYISLNILKQLDIIASAYEIETEVLIKASKLKYKIYSVDVATIYRDEESKINPLKDTVRFFVYLFREWKDRNK